jgi:hypothetical protein
MFDPSDEFVTEKIQFDLTRGSLEKVKECIRDALDEMGIDYFYHRVRGVHIIEDRKRRGF